jgi:hypothetical protein
MPASDKIEIGKSSHAGSNYKQNNNVETGVFAVIIHGAKVGNCVSQTRGAIINPIARSHAFLLVETKNAAGAVAAVAARNSSYFR